MVFRPLFVFGLARSGTNLLARVLDRHPSVIVALDPFLPVFRSLRNTIIATQASKELGQRFDPTSPFHDFYFDVDGPALLDLMLAAPSELPLTGDELDRLKMQSADRAALESPNLSARMGDLKGRDYRGLLKSCLDIVAKTKPDALWVGCKEVWVTEFAPLLARIFPEAFFYVIERDPRAIVASLLAMARRDPTQAAHPPSYLRHWRKQVALLHRFERDPLLKNRLRRVSFERFVMEPEEQAKKVCEDLGIRFAPEMLEVSADGWLGNSSYEYGGRNVYTHTVERWREVLPGPVVRVADFLCGPEMALTGYQTVREAHPAELLDFLSQAGSSHGSWSSGSGDLLVNCGGELVRRELLKCDKIPDESLVRRCFLFPDIWAAICRANS
jgi:hypothetical protein